MRLAHGRCTAATIQPRMPGGDLAYEFINLGGVFRVSHARYAVRAQVKILFVRVVIRVAQIAPLSACSNWSLTSDEECGAPA